MRPVLAHIRAELAEQLDGVILVVVVLVAYTIEAVWIGGAIAIHNDIQAAERTQEAVRLADGHGDLLNFDLAGFALTWHGDPIQRPVLVARDQPAARIDREVHPGAVLQLG